MHIVTQHKNSCNETEDRAVMKRHPSQPEGSGTVKVSCRIGSERRDGKKHFVRRKVA